MGNMVRRRRVACDRYARLEQWAFISLILDGNPHRYRLQTLEASRGLKIDALLAAVQSDSALGTIPAPVQIARKRGRAVVAARGRDGLHHPRQARTSDVYRRSWTLRTRALIALWSAVSGIIAAGVHIAALPVFAFAFHK